MVKLYKRLMRKEKCRNLKVVDEESLCKNKNLGFSAKIFVECEKVALNYNNIYYISFKERKMFLFKHII
ncbi:hypothetical protein PFBG_01580 [Plasmodium falciparum 7G8]|uniref:Uncharacterized protein n=1 Tax=Plasmodium falciparum (isolate 7G8) TaxID=57266 RepID=W7F4K7_PLAF8|nr:hypothetical protein PFBG_01580 [Plasmodium falciparum 7G8]